MRTAARSAPSRAALRSSLCRPFGILTPAPFGIPPPQASRTGRADATNEPDPHGILWLRVATSAHSHSMNRAPTPVPGTPSRPSWLLLALAAITLAVYAPVRHFDFVSIDDPLYVSENPEVAGGLSRAGVAWAFTTGHAATGTR